MAVAQNLTFFGRSGTSGDLGNNYEILGSAYYALRLFESELISNFNLSTNNNEMGSNDDLVIEATYQNGDKKMFALQLKHCAGDKKNITLNSFAADKGDFSLKKYFTDYIKIKEKYKDNPLSKHFYFILYTNKTLPIFGIYDKKGNKVETDQMKIKGTDIVIYKFDKCIADNLINLCEDGEFCYKFKSNNFTSDFLEHFALYTKQKNVTELGYLINGLISKICKTSQSNIIATHFLYFFKNWWSGDFGSLKLNKKMIELKLADYILTSFIPQPKLNIITQSNEKLIFLNKLMNNFDITIIEYENNFEDKVWQILDIDKLELPDNKTIPLVAKGKINDPALNKIFKLWHLCKIPLFIKSDDKSEEVILATVKFCYNDNNKRKFIIMHGKYLEDVFDNMTIFRDISQINKDFWNGLFISIQGRSKIPITDFVALDKHLLKLIRVKEIIKMCYDKFIIGNNAEELLPKFYLHRKIPKILLNAKVLNHLQQHGYHEEVSKEISCWKQEEKQHIFRTINSEKIEWLASNTNIDEIKPYRLSDFILEEEDLVPDWKIINYFNNKLNLICTDEGVGKSTILQFLATKCPTDYWAVIISLKRYILFFKDYHTPEETLKFILKAEEKDTITGEIVKIMAARRRVLFLWDGIDELPHESINYLITTIQQFALDGYWQWIAASNRSRNILETSFNVFALALTNFNEQEQKEFINNSLKEKQNNSVDEKFERNIEQTLGNFNFSGVPLLIKMLLEITLEESDKYLIKPKITDMIEKFIERKFLNYFERATVNPANFHIREIQRKMRNHYEISALMNSINEQIFSSLQVNYQQFLDLIWNKTDGLGLIVGFNHEKKPIFVQKFYQDFLAASWLARNYHKYPKLIDNCNENIRFMFNELLSSLKN